MPVSGSVTCRTFRRHRKASGCGVPAVSTEGDSVLVLVEESVGSRWLRGAGQGSAAGYRRGCVLGSILDYGNRRTGGQYRYRPRH